jgi:hypothetical protein
MKKKIPKRHSKLKPKIYPKVIKKKTVSKPKKTDKNLQIELNAIEIEEEKLQEELRTKYMMGDVLSNENKKKLKIIKSKKKIIKDQINKLANIEIEKVDKKLKDNQQQHTKHHRKNRRERKHHHHRSSSVSSLSNKREERDRHTFSNSFYSQNDLFKSVPKQKENQKKNHKGKDQKGDHKHDKKGDHKYDKKGDHRHDKKNEKPKEPNSPPPKPEISSNETNIKKLESKPEPKEKSAEEIYESMKEDSRKMLFISYVEFLIRNNIEGLHYYKIGKKNREEDYVLVSHLLEENPKYGKMWEKQLYKKIHQAIERNLESYWILEVFTGKTYKGSITNNIEEKEKYQKQFIQTLQNPNLAQPFINQITH